MTIMVKFELLSRNDKSEELQAFFAKILPATRKYAGNIGAELSVAQDSVTQVILLEHWETQENFDHYLNWRVEIGDFETLGSMLAHAPKIDVFKVLDNC